VLVSLSCLQRAGFAFFTVFAFEFGSQADSLLEMIRRLTRLRLGVVVLLLCFAISAAGQPGSTSSALWNLSTTCIFAGAIGSLPFAMPANLASSLQMSCDSSGSLFCLTSTALYQLDTTTGFGAALSQLLLTWI